MAPNGALDVPPKSEPVPVAAPKAELLAAPNAEAGDAEKLKAGVPEAAALLPPNIAPAKGYYLAVTRGSLSKAPRRNTVPRLLRADGAPIDIPALYIISSPLDAVWSLHLISCELF